jgi:hypothetical protein
MHSPAAQQSCERVRAPAAARAAAPGV